MTANTTTRARHVVVLVVSEGTIRGRRVIDMSAADYQPLQKELALRAAAAHPERRGQRWDPQVKLRNVASTRPILEVSSWSVDDHCQLALMRVPVSNLAWVGQQMITQLKLPEKNYTVQVAVLEPNHAWVRDFCEDEDFAVVQPDGDGPRLPSQFDTAPIRATQVIRPAETFLRCVFLPETWRQFLDAAAAESHNERGWAAAGKAHLAGDHADIVIEDIVELPAEATRASLLTRGSDFYRYHQQMGQRLVGYLHLHPPQVKHVTLGPVPSGPDSIVAWNLDASTQLPIAMPIAMFGAGTDCGKVRGQVAAHGYSHGLLREIQLEVML